jgi:hypothetical protein
MGSMPSVAIRSIVMTWEPEARLATIRFESATEATGEDASALVRALTGWLGMDLQPFGLLGDGSGLRSVDAQYRSIWSGFLRRRRESARVAFFNMGPVIRVAAEMFGLATGLKLKTFRGEAEARAWLRKMGIAA